MSSTEKRIMDFLVSWTKGVIKIGQEFLSDRDYVDCAKNFLSQQYAFDETEVLFKPTFTREVVFRNTKEKALSYFVKGQIDEDKGFALKPWEKIDLEKCHILQEKDFIGVMGSLLFKPIDVDEITKVAFTFILIEAEESLKIKIHHSSPIL